MCVMGLKLIRTFLFTGGLCLGLTDLVRADIIASISGPDLANFREIAGTLVEAGGMRVFDNPVEMGAALGQLLKDPERARAAGERARAAVEAGRGAIEATLRLLEKDVLKGI